MSRKQALATLAKVPSITEAMATSPQQAFRILDLPGELREEIYTLVMSPFPPIDTAAIPGTADRVTIPAITQTSQQLRDETLAVFCRNRPVQISLHCDDNVRRASAWTESWQAHAKGFATIIFSGKMLATGYEFFHVTIQSLRTAPYFVVRARPAISRRGDIIISRMLKKIRACLSRINNIVGEHQQAMLTTDQLPKLIQLVEKASKNHGLRQQDVEAAVEQRGGSRAR